MEPENLTPPDDPEFEDLIRSGLAQPALADGGFTARVMRSLPQRSAVAHYRAWLRLSWAGAGCGFFLAVWACSAWLGREMAYPRGEWPVSGLLGNAWLYLAFAAALAACLTAWQATDAARPD
jgi:hypothetical protein